MGDDEGRGQQFEAEDAADGRPLQPLGQQRPRPLLRQRGVDAAQHLHQIGPRAATRVEHDHPLVGQPVGQPQLLAQHAVDALHLIAHDLRRRIPDAQLLAQFGVIGAQERLIEVLHSVVFLETAEKCRPVDAVEHRPGPVERLVDAQRLQAAGRGDLVEQVADHGHVERPGRLVPVEAAVRPVGHVAAPQHPRREDAIEQRLHQRGPEEVLAALPLEAHAQRPLQRLFQHLEGA